MRSLSSRAWELGMPSQPGPVDLVCLLRSRQLKEMCGCALYTRRSDCNAFALLASTHPIPTYFWFQPGISCPLYHLFAIPPSLRIMHSVSFASSVLIFEGYPIKSGIFAVGFGAY
eukprot:RCo001142